MDVTVVGAGVVGCAVAFELASRGARVRVIDERQPGRGATWASAGMLAPYVEGHDRRSLALGLASLAMYDEFVARVGRDAGTAIEYAVCGTLQVAFTEDELRQLDAAAAAVAATGGACHLLGPSEARALEPGLSDRVIGALGIPAHGYVSAPALTLALARAAAVKGTVFESGRVARISRAAGAQTGLAVSTERATFETGAVVVAAGSWSACVHVGDGPRTEGPAPVTPVRGQLLYLRLENRAASHVIWHGSSYLVPWADGTTLAGATVEHVGFDERETPEGVSWLRDEAAAILPATRGASLVQTRVGLRPGTPDGLPIVGPSSTMPHVFYATGHYRNGVLLAPLTASLVADMVIDGRRHPVLDDTRPDRFGW